MGHAAGKDLYRSLGEKLDELPCRAPWSEAFRDVLKEVFTPDEAELLGRMPGSAATAAAVARAAGLDPAAARGRLEAMARKGLVVDLLIGGEQRYSPAPVVIGIFEFTMMRLKGDAAARLARLFHRYMEEDDAFFRANFGDGQRIAVMRSLPHEGTPAPGVEVLDYEKASAMVASAERIGVGVCSCRHKASHLGERACRAPMESCLSFGYAADFLVRRGLAREASRGWALESLARSRELGMVLNADNVRRGATFICQCCKCCCMALKGVRELGYPRSITTSSFLCGIDAARCNGCGACVRACPIDAISPGGPKARAGAKKAPPVVDLAVCLGCGVCALKCPTGAAALVPREARVIHPETTFRKIILSSLERGTLQHQLFADPRSVGQAFLRSTIGAFLGLAPVKRALMSDALRSVFLRGLESAARLRGDAWAVDL